VFQGLRLRLRTTVFAAFRLAVNRLGLLSLVIVPEGAALNCRWLRGAKGVVAATLKMKKPGCGPG